MIKKVFRNYKRNVGTFWLAFFVLILSSILITNIYNNPEVYTTVVLRVSVFFLGAIITINVYIYGKILSVSPIKFTSTARSKWMLLGVICSFGLLFILPTNFYHMPNLGFEYFRKIITTSWTFEKIISASSLILFVISTTIFITSLFNFVSSFNVKRTIQKNYKNIIEVNILKKIFKLDRLINKLTKEDNNKEKKSIEKFRLLNSKAYSTALGKEEIIVLSRDLEIFIDNLSYLINLNHSEYIRKFIIDWSKICGHIQSAIYHSKSINEEHEKLYLKTLVETMKIIDKTVNDINLKEYFEESLNILILSLPIFKEDLDEDSKKQYTQNFDKLALIYYKELLRIIEYINFEKKHIDILNVLLHDETFNSNVIENYSFLMNRAKIQVSSKGYNEHLLIGLLYKSVCKNCNIDLPIIIALITKTQETKTKDLEESSYTIRTKKTAEDINNMFKSIANESSSEWDSWLKNTKKVDTKFTDSILSYLIIIIVKACEIENYKAASYLVKRICNSSDYKQIVKVLNLLKDDIYDVNKLSLRMFNISLNDYSLKYCFNKTIFLLMLHISYEKKLNINFTEFVAKEFRSNILDSIKEKHKEYNLYSINNEYLKKLNLI